MTEATASKETVTPARKPRRTDLRLVDHEQAAAEIITSDTPPAALTVPAIEPLSEYRAHEHRRRLDAQGEIDLIDDRERRADAMSKAIIDALVDDCDAEMRAAISKRDRAIAFEAQRRDAERQEARRHREQHVQIVAGADAAIAASPPLESASAVTGSGGETP